MRSHPTVATASFAGFAKGTPFLSQLQTDMGALLDQKLSAGAKDDITTNELIAQLGVRLGSGLASAVPGTSLLAMFLDPVSLDLQDPAGQHVTYNLTTGDFNNNIPNAFVSVASNIELVVIPLVSGRYNLDVSDVPGTARGGAMCYTATRKMRCRLLTVTSGYH